MNESGTHTETTTETVNELRGVKVHFISLAGRPHNKRQFILKALEGENEVVEKQVRILKADAKKRIAYGIVLAPDEVDDENDTVTPDEIEKAAYGFMHSGRTAQIDRDHDEATVDAFVAESWIVKAGDSLFAEEPLGSWAVGVKVLDADVWDQIEKGTLTGFSIGAVAKRVPVETEIIEEEGTKMKKAEQAATDPKRRWLAYDGSPPLVRGIV